MMKCPCCKQETPLIVLSREEIESAIDRILFFGVWPGFRAGHFLYNRYGKNVLERQFGLDSAETLPIVGNEDQYGMRGEQKQGYARYRVRNRNGIPWSYVTFWDRTEDKRGASNGAFLIDGDVSADYILGLAEIAFPRKWAQLQEAGGIEVKEFC